MQVVDEYFHSIKRVDVSSQMDEGEAIVIYNLCDVEVGPREDTCQLHEITAIDISDDLSLVVLLIKNLFETIVLTLCEELWLRGNATVALSLRCDVVTTATSDDG